jgi:hypothetical protein
LLSASLFSRASKRLEQEYTLPVSEEILSEHRAYVTGSVLSSVAAIEAAINEFFLEVIDRNTDISKTLGKAVIETLEELWGVTEDKPILTKYQLALIASKKPRFEKDRPPFQTIDNLIKLRNALVHFRPEWDVDLKDHKKLEDRVKGQFKLNPFAFPGQVFFPYKCLGHGCAQWATLMSRQFLEEFYSRVGKVSRFSDYGTRLDA